MTTHNCGSSRFGRVISWFLVGIVALVALRLAFWVIGAAVGFGVWFLFTAGPILLVGWLMVKLFRYFTRPSEYADL